MTIRIALSNEDRAIKELYPKAFPNEDLLALVCDLLASEKITRSFVAVQDGTLAGHVFFTLCHVMPASHPVALLGPIAVDPQRQKQGIGQALILKGFEQLRHEGIDTVFVLGDPAYYSRFRFQPDTLVEPPFPLPDAWRDAWQSVALDKTAAPPKGRLAVPPPWQRPDLWR